MLSSSHFSIPYMRKRTSPRGGLPYCLNLHVVAALSLAACLTLYLGSRALSGRNDVNLAPQPLDRGPSSPVDSSTLGVQINRLWLSGKHARVKNVRRWARDALVAAFVADSASSGLHWQYDVAAIAELVSERGGVPEFLSPPATQFYDVPVGGPSPCE